MEALVWLTIFFWLLPILVAHSIGVRRNRTGWLYGFLLGWLGVLILALTSYLPTDAERRVREIEAQRRLAELEPPPLADWVSARLPASDNPHYVP